jgi:hypothetical protein
VTGGWITPTINTFPRSARLPADHPRRGEVYVGHILEGLGRVLRDVWRVLWDIGRVMEDVGGVFEDVGINDDLPLCFLPHILPFPKSENS